MIHLDLALLYEYTSKGENYDFVFRKFWKMQQKK